MCNDAEATQQGKLRGALGAKPSTDDAIAYVFKKGILGGTGTIAGSVDNYGTIEPGDPATATPAPTALIGSPAPSTSQQSRSAQRVTAGSPSSPSPATLTLRNFASPSKAPNLTLHPASILRFKLASHDSHDQLTVAGNLKYSNICEDFTTADQMPIIEVSVLGGFPAESVGSELTLLTAKAKTGSWNFDFKTPSQHTWKLEERSTADGYALILTLLSLDNPTDPDDPTDPADDSGTTMGAFYDDSINDNTDAHTLRYYAEKNNKHIGIALSTYKGYQSERDEAGRQFNMMVAENEMKMDALQPTQGQFAFGSADKLVSFARNNNMSVRGHCLVWHQQQPQWLSSDGKKNDHNWTRQQALEILRNHITTVMQHFKGRVAEWDVVNECLDDDQSALRTNPDTYTLRRTYGSGP